MKIKLGELIEQYSVKNTKNSYSINDVVGISTSKYFISTKANLDGVSLSSYKIVKPNHFAFVPDTSRRGDKISLAFNSTQNTFLVSSISVVFSVKNTEKLLPFYLFLYFNRPEFDRYSRFHSWGSAREAFSWEDMCNIELDLPDITIQQKYVAVYQALLANQQAYEKGLDDLKLVCDGYIEHLQKTETLQRIGDFIIEYKGKNNGKLGENDVMGIATTKNFIETKSNLDGVNLDNYLIVKPKYFAYVADTSRRNDKVSLAFNNSENSYLVSSISTVFYSKDETQLLPEYLALFFNRSEFDRYARFHSWGSAREVFAWADLCDVKIPIVDIEKQQAIVDIYKVLLDRRAINDTLKQQIKAICPVLVRGAVAEMAK